MPESDHPTSSRAVTSGTVTISTPLHAINAVSVSHQPSIAERTSRSESTLILQPDSTKVVGLATNIPVSEQWSLTVTLKCPKD